jgi:uncharacterized protein (TIGR00730 family)
MSEEKNLDLSKITDADLPAQKEDFRQTFQWRIFRIMAEFIDGYQFVTDNKESVTILGGSAFSEDNINYQKARQMGKLLSQAGFSVVTGGGPGIMEAANRGCYEEDGNSIGINIFLEEGERKNKYLKRSIGFHYFFTRKVMLSFASSGYIFFPGGFGTLDEFFEIVTLIQTKKLIPACPIVAVGKDYWGPLFDWIRSELFYTQKTIKGENLDLFELVDTPEEALEIIKKYKEEKK